MEKMRKVVHCGAQTDNRPSVNGYIDPDHIVSTLYKYLDANTFKVNPTFQSTNDKKSF